MGSLTSFWWFLCFDVLFRVHGENSECEYKKEGPYIPVIAKLPLGDLVGKIGIFQDAIYTNPIRVREFLGVPYARPPLRHLRFRRPGRLEAWKPRKEVVCMPNACIQSTSSWPWSISKSVRMSEDCLYMNIWVPHMQKSYQDDLKAVLFFIHGGGINNVSGSASDPVYHGRRLSGIGDIIVVVPNYRLGTLGFWSSANGPFSKQRLRSKDSRAPGNVGIWDIIAALQFVYENIYFFGGDNRRITLAGHGMGAVIASLLSIAPQTSELFKRLILQSGSAMWQQNKHMTYNYNISEKIAENMNCADSSTTLANNEDLVINCMLEQDPLELIGAEEHTDQFFPVWGDDLFKSNPREEIFRKKLLFTELFIGFSGNEGVPILLDKYKKFGIFGKNSLSRGDKDLLVKDIMEDWFPFPNFTEIYKPIHVGPGTIGMDDRYYLADAFGDYTVKCPEIYYAQKSVQSGAKVYFYHFTYRPVRSKWADWVGPTHFDEIYFVFGGPYDNSPFEEYSSPTLNARFPQEWFTDDEKKFSKFTMKLWSNFVKNGRPRSDWPVFDLCDFHTIYIMDRNSDLTASPHYLTERCQFWRHRY